MNKILLSILLLSSIIIMGCSKIDTNDYIICGMAAVCPIGYDTQFIGGQCSRCYIPTEINYTIDFNPITIDISANISRAYSSGMASGLSQLIENTKDCRIAVLEVSNGDAKMVRELIDIACINITEQNSTGGNTNGGNNLTE